MIERGRRLVRWRPSSFRWQRLRFQHCSILRSICSIGHRIRTKSVLVRFCSRNSCLWYRQQCICLCRNVRRDPPLVRHVHTCWRHFAKRWGEHGLLTVGQEPRLHDLGRREPCRKRRQRRARRRCGWRSDGILQRMTVSNAVLAQAGKVQRVWPFFVLSRGVGFLRVVWRVAQLCAQQAASKYRRAVH